MNVSVSQCPIGTSPIRRSPRGLQPLGRTMLVVTALSSINTRRAGSSSPCSRIQRRRFRATSSRFRSAARRLFFNSDAMTSEKSGERAAASRNFALAQCQNDLIQREVRFLPVERKDLLGVLLQWRSASAACIGSQVPSSRKRCIHLMAELTPTSNCSAASRREPPASTKPMTRLLNSPGYGPRIG
jgi:hypothetical protein